MNELTTRPPNERELPLGHSDRLRARVMAYADTPRPRTSLRLAPVAASAAVLAVAAGTVLAVQSHGSKHDSPAGAKPVTIDDATLAARCGLPGGQVLVRFTDRFGGYAVVTDTKHRKRVDCFLTVDGSVDPGSQGSEVPAPATEKQVAEVWSWGDGMALTGLKMPTKVNACIVPGRPTPGGSALPAPRQVSRIPASPRGSWSSVECDGSPQHEVFGTVAADVARVTITWDHRPQVTAAIYNHFFAARYVDANGEPQQSSGPNFTVRAYDAAGHLMTQYTQQD